MQSSHLLVLCIHNSVGHNFLLKFVIVLFAILTICTNELPLSDALIFVEFMEDWTKESEQQLPLIALVFLSSSGLLWKWRQTDRQTGHIRCWCGGPGSGAFTCKTEPYVTGGPQHRSPATTTAQRSHYTLPPEPLTRAREGEEEEEEGEGEGR